jgi:phage shock protein PspC (stress-responsive transcriptional regulator)/predicted membrane protein
MGARPAMTEDGAMSDESTPDDTATSTEDPTQELPPPPPPGDPAAPFRLRRSSSERMIAGVCGGTAEHFAIDPIIVRLGFVALTLFGGSGIALYLIAWLVMPDASEDESAALNALRGGHRAGGRSLLAVALLIVGIIIFSGSLLWFPSVGDGLFLPLLILAAGIALLVWPSDGVGWQSRWHVDNDEWRTERNAVRAEWRRERNAWRETRQNWRHGYRRGFDADPQGPAPQPGPSEQPPPPAPGLQPPSPFPPPPRPPRVRHGRPKPKPFLGPLAIALLLLFTGFTVFGNRVDWWTVEPAPFLAICLMILGAVLVVSAYIGRARGLIWLGVLLLPIAWAFSTVDLTWWEGIGEEQVTVASLDQLDDSYRWGIGEFHVDLSNLDLEGETVDLAVGLTIGELKVWVPDTMAVEIDLDGRLGSVILSDNDVRLNDDGFDLDLDRTVGDPSGGTLLLNVDLGIGEAEVIVCGAGGIPCP